QGRAVGEDGQQDGLLGHRRDVNGLLDALVEEHRELRLTEELGHGAGRAERSGGEGRDGDSVERPGHAVHGEELAATVDEKRLQRGGLAQEFLENLPDPRRIVFLNDHVSHLRHAPPFPPSPNSLARTMRETVLRVSKTPLPSTATPSKKGTRRALRLSRYSR